MTLYNFTSAFERQIVERVRKLAQTSANSWNKTSLAQLSSDRISQRLLCFSDLLPKTKNCASRNFCPVQTAACLTQVLNFAELQRVLHRTFGSPKRRLAFGQQHWVIGLFTVFQTMHRMCQVRH